jgi:hypothetical protein
MKYKWRAYLKEITKKTGSWNDSIALLVKLFCFDDM